MNIANKIQADGWIKSQWMNGQYYKWTDKK